ncbi:MAG TPA: hypothetical protein VF453_02880 [Burkholderiaceae bacterium]
MFDLLAKQINSSAINGIRLFDIDPADLHKASLDFVRDGYVLVKQALTPEFCEFCESTIKFDERVRSDSRQFYRDHNLKDGMSDVLVEMFHSLSVPLFAAIAGMTVKKQYSFAMKYVAGSNLLPHWDLDLNSISATVCYKGSSQSNPIYIDRARFLNPYVNRVTIKDKGSIPRANVARIDVEHRDIGIFRGREHLHWRDLIEFEEDYRAMLIHFTDYNLNGVSMDPPKRDQIEGIRAALIDCEDYMEFRQRYCMYFDNRTGY